MPTSDIKKSRKEIEKLVFNYLIVTMGCAGFGAVYEVFSHGVYSYYMLYAFMIPFLGGVVYFYCILYFRSKTPECIARRFQHFGISTLTVGFILCGVLEIYGTSNCLVIFYFIVGGMFLVSGNFMYLLQKEPVCKREADV